MKIFGFVKNSEKRFVNITCNIILCATLVVVLSLSIFAPLTLTASVPSESAIYHGDTESNNVCLMINVYWGTEYLDSMLKTLKDSGVKTTFFVGGSWVAKNNEMLRKIYDDGHEIANHGYYHKDHAKLSREQNQNEIYLTQTLVEEIVGVKTNLFAPPSGSFNNKVISVASDLGYKTIMWTHDTIDWRDKNENLIFDRATKKTVGGDLILMHPTGKTALALGDIISTLKNKGLNLTTVSNVIK